MSIQLDADARRKQQALKAALKAIEAPSKKARQAVAKIQRRERAKRVGKPSEGQRQPRQRDNGFLAYLRRLPCAYGAVMGGCDGRTEAAHLRFSNDAVGRANPGMQNKSHDWFCNPLCRAHHNDHQHKMAEKLFWARAGIDPDELSAALYAAYQAGEPGEVVIRQFAHDAKARGA